MEGTVSPSPESEKFFSRVLLVLIAVAAVLRVPLVFRLNIDGDEFRFLSLVYEHLRGQLGTPLMTIHVYLFQWLPLVSANEADQIVAARVVMLALSLGSAVLTYLIGRMFLSRPGALFATLCYLTFSNVVVHGASFRFDPICSFFFLLSLYWLLSAPTRPVGRLLRAGACLSLALLVSLKSVFFVATVAAVLLPGFVPPAREWAGGNGARSEPGSCSSRLRCSGFTWGDSHKERRMRRRPPSAWRAPCWARQGSFRNGATFYSAC